MAIGALALLLAAAAVAGTRTRLTFSGIGPLKLGMKLQTAVGTGWLTRRGTGCPLGGKPYPVTYSFTGRKAPRGIKGTAQFSRGKLQVLSFGAGVTTDAGLTVGKATIHEMVSLYRRRGDKVSTQFDKTFGGTFVTVRHHGKVVMQGFGAHSRLQMLAIPFVPVCD